MELTVIDHIDLPYINLFGIGDVHCGSPECDEDLFQSDIEAIANDPHSYCFFNGDLLNYNIKTSVGNLYHEKYSPSDQKRIFREWVKPVTSKTLYMIGGNHDEGRSQEDSRPVQDMADMLGVRYLDTEALLKIPVGAKKKNGKPAVYTTYSIHGCGGGKTIGGSMNKLHELSNVVHVDVYYMSHVHKIGCFLDSIYETDLHNGNSINRQRLYSLLGSYQGRGVYPKSKAMRPGVLGTPRTTFYGTHKQIDITVTARGN